MALNERWVTVTQPHFAPSLLMAERVSKCSVVVVMNEVLFDRGHMSSVLYPKYGRLKIAPPLKKAGKRPFDHVAVGPVDRWAQKLIRTLDVAYGRLPMYKEHGPQVHAWIENEVFEGISCDQLGVSAYRHMLECLGLNCAVRESLPLVPKRPEHASEWVAELTFQVGGNCYLQGRKSMEAYFRQDDFDRRGIRLFCQEFYPRYEHEGYPVVGADACWWDLLFKLGPEGVRWFLEEDTVQPWQAVK